LCNRISQVEWSGILLYDIEGSIKDPDKMKIILKDIIPMDKGSSAYTEYDFNKNQEDKHIDYTNKREEALLWSIGHIHSHGNMSVFFSGTDMDELKENSNAHNFYLSMIVNNAMDMTAKIGFKATAGNCSYIALDENGEKYVVLNSKEKEVFFIYDCIITTETQMIVIEDLDFIKNVEDILKPKQQPDLFSLDYLKVNKDNDELGEGEVLIDNMDELKGYDYDIDNPKFYDMPYFDFEQRRVRKVKVNLKNNK